MFDEPAVLSVIVVPAVLSVFVLPAVWAAAELANGPVFVEHSVMLAGALVVTGLTVADPVIHVYTLCLTLPFFYSG